MKISKLKQSYTDDGILINSNELNGMKAQKSLYQILDILEKKNWKKKN